MFPVAFSVCLIATSASVEGAVFFAPIFLLVFPVAAGVDISTTEAIFIALATELFGFGSALIGYLRRHLVDITIATKVLKTSIPLAVVFGFLSHMIPGTLITALLGLMMFALSAAMFSAYRRGGRTVQQGEACGNEHDPAAGETCNPKASYRYRHGPIGFIWSAVGGMFVGLTGIGIGELATSVLIIRNRVPSRVAVGTGVMIVALTVLPATLVHATVFWTGSFTVHWNILFMTIPAVACGGQVSPFINARVHGDKIKAFLSLVFIVVSVLLLYRAWASAALFNA